MYFLLLGLGMFVRVHIEVDCTGQLGSLGLN